MQRVDRALRVLRLIAVLTGQRNGCTLQHITRAMSSSRATAYRDLDLVRRSGYAVQKRTVNGEARYALAASTLSTQPMTPRERAAIGLARRALSPVEGTWIVRELDALLTRAQGVSAQDSGVQLALAPTLYDPEGALDVCARVCGLHETLRWVLRWGRGAEVREPAALRALVREELAGALERYGDRVSRDFETSVARAPTFRRDAP